MFMVISASTTTRIGDGTFRAPRARPCLRERLANSVARRDIKTTKGRGSFTLVPASISDAVRLIEQRGVPGTK